MLVIETFGKSISNAQKRWVEAVEKRLSVTTEILTSMKGIKMSGLSKYSSALLQGLRETELVVSLTMRRFLAVGTGLCMFLSQCGLCMFMKKLIPFKHSPRQPFPPWWALQYILHWLHIMEIHFWLRQRSQRCRSSIS